MEDEELGDEAVVEVPDTAVVEEVVEVTEPEPKPESTIQINNGDDMSDMFRPPSRDDPDMQTDDLVSVSDEDVFGEGGEDMSDLLEVDDEDLMGELEPEPEPSPPVRTVRRVRRVARPRRDVPPTSMGGIR